MTYRLGVDVGGTFTDLLLVNERTGQTWKAKVSSTPRDQSEGVLRGIERVCGLAGISAEEIDHVMHGTTVATNTVLTGTGARVGLVTTRGYRQVLQIARSFVPGGLGGWVIYNKSLPMAPLALTIEADERVGSRGDVVTALDEAKLRAILLNEFNLEIGAGLGALAGKIVRIGLMGQSASNRNVMFCLAALEAALIEARSATPVAAHA